MENFWSTLNTELVYPASWRTRDEAEKRALRLHRRLVQPAASRPGLADRSPDEYGTAWYAAKRRSDTDPDHA
jgi:hypothetical protein